MEISTTDEANPRKPELMDDSFFSNSEKMPAGGESHPAQGNSCADVGEVVQRLQRPGRAQLPLRVEFICHLSHEHDGLQH